MKEELKEPPLVRSTGLYLFPWTHPGYMTHADTLLNFMRKHAPHVGSTLQKTVVHFAVMQIEKAELAHVITQDGSTWHVQLMRGTVKAAQTKAQHDGKRSYLGFLAEFVDEEYCNEDAPTKGLPQTDDARFKYRANNRRLCDFCSVCAAFEEELKRNG